jgi:uncharacterized integral membrane protein
MDGAILSVGLFNRTYKEDAAMRIRTLFLLLILVAVVLFAAVNWSAFTTPTTLSLLVATVEAPLGIIMLGMVVILTVLFVLYAGYLQTSAFLEARQHAKEIQAQRKVADQAEASRIADLQNLLTSSLMKLEQQALEARAANAARLDRMEDELRQAISQEGATMSAYIGELEDRLERHLDVRSSARSG